MEGSSHRAGHVWGTPLAFPCPGTKLINCSGRRASSTVESDMRGERQWRYPHPGSRIMNCCMNAVWKI